MELEYSDKNSRRSKVYIAVGIIVQAVVGGITVRTGLNPWVVGVHFVISAVLIALAAVLVNRTRRVSLDAVAVAERPGQVVGREIGPGHDGHGRIGN